MVSRGAVCMRFNSFRNFANSSFLNDFDTTFEHVNMCILDSSSVLQNGHLGDGCECDEKKAVANKTT